MERNQLKGLWNDLKGRLKQSFGRQTGDDVIEAEGNVDRAKGQLQQRFGEAKERAAQKINQLFDRYRARRRPPAGREFGEPTP
jgi:uncharacterized protein YjbJ (UPF0337 family)